MKFTNRPTIIPLDGDKIRALYVPGCQLFHPNGNWVNFQAFILTPAGKRVRKSYLPTSLFTRKNRKAGAIGDLKVWIVP